MKHLTLAWNERKNSNFILLVALIGLSYLLFDPIVKYVILGRLVLRNESDFADLWKNPPITPHFKVSFDKNS